MKVERKTLTANTETNFLEGVEGYKFLVKNFTPGNIIAKLEGDTVGVKIPKMCAEVVTENVRGLVEASGVKVTAEEAGEVEVRCIDFY